MPISVGENVMIFNRRSGERRQAERTTAERRQLDRRQLLKIGGIVTVAGLFAHPVAAAAGRLLLPSREISLFNTHTGEKLSVEYCAEGEYRREALQEINHILRDFRTGEVEPIDPRLLNLLTAITDKVKARSRIHIISGYRSPATNLLLAGRNGGVAKNSLHMTGKAIDIRIPGCELKTLQRAAQELRAGGVGYYAKSDFIHVDTGRVRFW
jgi:uncharacterized protein YcbK (DUF882 family)